MENLDPQEASPPSPAEKEPPSVWRIHVPSCGYYWFTEDYGRVVFWLDRSDAVVTSYARWAP